MSLFPRTTPRVLPLALIVACAVARPPPAPAAPGAARGQGAGARPASRHRPSVAPAPRPARARGTTAARGGARLQGGRAARRDPLAAHLPVLASLDRLTAGLHRRGDGVEIFLKGGTLRRVIAAAGRGEPPRFDDIDLVIVGLPVPRALEAVQRAFPEVDPARDLVEKPGFLPGVRHVQIEVPPGWRRAALQLDLAIYEPDQRAAARVLAEPYPGISFAKLKLEVPRGARLSDLLRKASRPASARRMRELRDPDGTGRIDLTRGWIRVRRLAGQDDRLPEGILQGMYLVAKYGDLRLAPETEALYRELGAADYTRFFAAEGLPPGRAAVRTNYLLSVFREDAGRDPARALELGRSVGLWGKVLPGMERVSRDEARWRRTVARVDRAYRQASAQPGRLGRAWVFGALLAELPSEAAARRALSRLSLPQSATPGARATRAEILAAYRQHRAEADGALAPLR